MMVKKYNVFIETSRVVNMRKYLVENEEDTL